MQISVHTAMKSTKEAISERKTQKSIHWRPNHFWDPIAHVSIKVQYEKTSIRNLKHSWEETHSNDEGNYTHQCNEVKKEAVTSFLHSCLNHIWAPGRRHECNPKKLKTFSGRRRPETLFRHAQGHQRVCALTSTSKIFESRILTVYEVVHQKAGNTKLAKQTIWLSEIIKEFHHYFQEKRTGRHKSIQRKVILPS